VSPGANIDGRAHRKSAISAGTPLALGRRVRVRLTKKLAERLDGVDLTRCRVGDALNLPAHEAQLLIAEQWATPEERRRVNIGPFRLERRVATADDRDNPPRPLKESELDV
jgi:hypothetical protein